MTNLNGNTSSCVFYSSLGDGIREVHKTKDVKRWFQMVRWTKLNGHTGNQTEAYKRTFKLWHINYSSAPRCMQHRAVITVMGKNCPGIEAPVSFIHSWIVALTSTTKLIFAQACKRIKEWDVYHPKGASHHINCATLFIRLQHIDEPRSVWSFFRDGGLLLFIANFLYIIADNISLTIDIII